MKPGLYKISNEEYHSGPGVSKSFLHDLLRSPAHALTPKKETPALLDGQALHMCMFEPSRYKKEYTIKSEGMKLNTKDGIAWYIAWKEINKGKKILDFEKDVDFLEITKAVKEHLVAYKDPVIQGLLSHGEPEISGYWNDPDNPEILCKLRMDWLNKKDRIVVDLKSCTDARPERFTWDAIKYGYHMQAFWYLYGLTQITRIEHHDFYFISVEKIKPYGVQVYKASEEFIQKGAVDCSRAIAIYQKCQKEALWPCYEAVVRELELPGRMKKKNEIRVIYD